MNGAYIGSINQAKQEKVPGRDVRDGRPHEKLCRQPSGSHHQGNNADKPYRFRYVMRCISLGREDGLVQFVEADDTPKERILTSRIGAKVKEFVSRGSVWNVQMERILASLMTRNQSNKKGVNNHVSDNQLTYRHSRSA